MTITRIRCRFFDATLAGIVLLWLFQASASANEFDREIEFDIAPQSLASAMLRFADQSNIQVVTSSAQLERYRSQGLNGRYPVRAALEALLSGTGLMFRQVGSGTVSIEKGEPVQGKPSTGIAPTSTSPAAIRLAQQDASKSSVGSPATSDSGLEEVIVTATKRAENIKNVPQSITAIGSSEITSRGLTGMADYLSAVPGVSLVEMSSVSNAVVIRGIDTGPVFQNFGAGPTVATYFGETPITNTAGLLGGSGVDVKLVDMERIEVLRGPQGTAFGNSSLGGAIRTIPAAPRLDSVEGKVGASYSHTGEYGGANSMLQGVFNAPLVAGKVAIRVVGYRYDNSGYYRNVSASDPLITAYAESLGAQAESLLMSDDDQGADRQRGGRIALLWQATDALKLTLSHLHQEVQQDGNVFGSDTLGRYDYAGFKLLPGRGTRGGQDSVFDNEIDLTNLTLEYGLGWADLVASVSRIDAVTHRESGASVFRPYDFVSRSPHRSLASEIRLVSAFDGPFQFIGGLYYEKLEDFSSEVYGALEIPALNPYGDGVNEVLGIFDNSRELRQEAVFSEVSYDLLRNLTLTVGGRFYRFERNNTLETSGWFTDAPLGSPDVSAVELDKSGENFKANLAFKPTENALLYASWSQGFRLGRPAAGLIPGICDTDGDGLVDGTDVTIQSTREIDSDKLDNTEVGAKVTLLGGRVALEASAYQIDWTGLPADTSAECSGSSYFYVANAGAAESQGFEFQSSFHLARGLRLALGGSYTDARLTTDVPDLGAVAGARLPGAPKWITSLGVQYDFNMGRHASFVRADTSYRGSFPTELTGSPLTRAGGFVRVDARAGIQVRGVDVALFVNNLTNVDDYSWRFEDFDYTATGFVTRPRTVGLQLGYEFR